MDTSTNAIKSYQCACTLRLLVLKSICHFSHGIIFQWPVLELL